MTLNGVGLVATLPPCGCGFVHNYEEVEGKVALMERGDCSFVSKVRRRGVQGLTLVHYWSLMV